MKTQTVVLTAVFSLAVSGGMISAQTASATAGEDVSAKAAEEARQEAITNRYLTPVHGELASKLDTRNAQAGQEVAVRTTEDARLANDTELPKGTILHGRVSQVHAEGQQSSGAMVALTFDRAEVKGGKMIPVRCVIQGVNPVKPIPGADRMAMAGPRGSTGMDSTSVPGAQGIPSIGTDAGSMGTGVGRVGTQRRTGVAPMGSGVPIGGMPTDTGTAGSTGPGVGAGTGADSTIGGVGGVGTGSTGSIGTTSPVNGLPGSVVGSGPVGTGTYGVAPVVKAGEDISARVIPTGFPGLLLSNQRTGGASGVLVESGRNITLDGGTHITMGVITR